MKLFTGHNVFVRPFVAEQIDPGKRHVHQASVVAVAPSKQTLPAVAHPVTAHTATLRFVPANRPLPAPLRDLADAGLLDLSVPTVLAWRDHGNVVALDPDGRLRVVAQRRYSQAAGRFTFDTPEPA